MPCSRAAAFIRTIQSARKLRFLVLRSRYAYCKPFSTVFLATVHTLPREPKYPFDNFNVFFLRALLATAFT